MLLWTKRIIGWLSFLALIGWLVSAGWVGYLSETGRGIDDIEWGRAPWRFELPQPDPTQVTDYVRQNGLGPDLEAKLNAYVTAQVAPKAYAAPDRRGRVKKYRNALAVLVLDPKGTTAASYPDYFKGERFTYPLDFGLMASEQPLFYPGEYVNIYTRREAEVRIDVDGLVIDIPDRERATAEEIDENVSDSDAQWRRRTWARDVRMRIDDYIPCSDAAMTQMLRGPDGKPAAILFTALNRDLQLKGAFWQGLWEEFGPGYRVAILMIASIAAFWLLLGMWAGFDARWRGMSAWVWTIVLLITNVIGLLVYLLVRVPDPRTCPQCRKRVHDRFAACPYCGFEMQSRCPACRTYMQPGWRYCPACKLDLWSEEAKAQSPQPPTKPPGHRGSGPFRTLAELVQPPEAPPASKEETAAAAPAPPRPDGVTISVRTVDDATGGAVGGVRLTFSGPSSLTATTDSGGMGRAYGAEAGAYTVAADKVGYEPGELSVELQAGETPELVLALKPQTGALAGRVVADETSDPIAAAKVSIDSVRVDKDAHAGPDGSFRFDEIPPGPYIVAAQKEGYLSARQSAQVRPGEETSLDFRLRRDPGADAAAQAESGGEGDG